ncbi:MAG: MFS transporter [Acidobacteria bacterium]|nr:MFS transporter [Acidobacteriota bacterium]MBS1865578.1 MFS transporter [Acidobacteriota bacterium]
MMSSKTQIQPVQENSSRALIFWLLCFGFVINGLIINFVGPLLPTFRAKWALDDGRAGLFSTVQFTVSLVGVLLSSPLITKKGFKPAITFGLALMGIGFAFLNAPTFALALVASGVYGFGYGFVTPGTNLWVGESYGERRASALNLANLAWGLGAILSAPTAMYSIRTSSINSALYISGAISILLALYLARQHFGKPHEEAASLPSDNAKVAGNGVAILLCILFYVYVGTEVSTSYWAATHAERAATWATNTFTLAPMFFFGGLLGGRGAAAAILLRLKEGTVAIGGLLIAAAGELIFLTAHSPALLFIGAFFAGLGFSSLYPIYVAWLTKWFGSRARKVGGVMFASAAIGSATLPWLVGEISRATSSLRVGLIVPLVGCAIMLTIVALLRPNARG